MWVALAQPRRPLTFVAGRARDREPASRSLPDEADFQRLCLSVVGAAFLLACMALMLHHGFDVAPDLNQLVFRTHFYSLRLAIYL